MTGRPEYRVLRATLLFLVGFDLAIAIPALFFPHEIIALGHLADPAIPGAPYREGTIEPLFFRGVGILWVLAAYTQYVAWRAPAARLVAVNIAIVFRFVGGTFELVLLTWLLPRVGFSHWLIYWILPVFIVGDYLLVGLMVWLLRRLDLPWTKLPRD